MIKLTLLQLVQDILTEVGDNSVADVSDNTSAADIVNVCNRVYESLITNYKWKHIREYGNLEVGDNINELVGPEGTSFIAISTLRYGEQGSERRVQWKDPEDFITLTINRNTEDSDVTLINGLKIRNNSQPVYATSFDDETLVLDAIPTGAGLVAGDSWAMIYKTPTTRLSSNADKFNLPAKAFPLFEAFCIAEAYNVLLQDTLSGRKWESKAQRMLNKLMLQGNIVTPARDLRSSTPVRNGGRTTRRVRFIN